MSATHSDLAQEFPAWKDLIHQMKAEDHHFARLLEEYHTFGRELHRIDQGIETPQDSYVEALKKKRLALKDQLCGLLSARQRGA